MIGQKEAIQKIINGVDIGKVEGTIQAIQENPDLAKFKFRANNQWISGGHNRSTIDEFYGAAQENSRSSPFVLEADEPALLAGEDGAANPVEYLLHALAGCLTTTLVYHAAVHGIQLEEVEAELEGDIDLRGFLGLSNEVRRGYENIRVTYRVRTDESNIEKLKALSKLSPVFDVTANGTKVDVQIERK
jgi:uncharacterized OsmC-like protein